MICNPSDFSFIADEMCGRIARWLRLLGFDTYYFTGKSGSVQITDDYILHIAAVGKRRIITRDRELCRRAKHLEIPCLLITHDSIVEKLRYILKKYLNCETIVVKPRCPLCNSQLIEVDRGDVVDLVPERVFHSQNVFLICKRCNKVYWFGSHWNYITSLIESIGLEIRWGKIDNKRIFDVL